MAAGIYNLRALDALKAIKNYNWINWLFIQINNTKPKVVEKILPNSVADSKMNA